MKKIFLILTSLILTGCASYIINSEGYIRPPENYKFSYKNRTTDKDTYEKIDTNAIYYMAEQPLYKHESEYTRRGAYLRFYSNGRFKMQGVSEFPKLENINNVEKGIVGYFFVKGNVIKMQIYTDINAGSNQLEFGVIEENGGLNILDENPRVVYSIGFTEKVIRRKIEKHSTNPQIYKKIPIEGLIYKKTDW